MLFAEEGPIAREIDAEEGAQVLIFAGEDLFQARPDRVVHRGRTTGRQVELSKVVDEALQGVARLGLCRIRKLAFENFWPSTV